MSPGRITLPGLARLLVLYAFVGVLLAISRPTPALVAAGAAVAGAGEALRVWAAGHLVKERIEGTRLRLRHGDAFARYARVVPRLLPSWRRYPGEPGGWSARLMARNREPAVALGLLLVFGLLAWKSAGR